MYNYYNYENTKYYLLPIFVLILLFIFLKHHGAHAIALFCAWAVFCSIWVSVSMLYFYWRTHVQNGIVQRKYAGFAADNKSFIKALKERQKIELYEWKVLTNRLFYLCIISFIIAVFLTFGPRKLT